MQRSIVIALLLVLALSGSAVHARDSRNAFTWYSKAQELMVKIPRERLEKALNYHSELREDPTLEIPADVVATLQQLQPALERVKRGSQQQFSDTGLDFSQGIELMLPHIQDMRSLAKLASLDAEVKLRGGDAAGAADRVATLYRMADHLTDDRVLISSLVARSVYGIADRDLENGLDRGVFRPEDAASMLIALKTLPATDPFGAVEAIISEQDMIVGWLERLRPPEADQDELHDDLLKVMPEDQAEQFEQMTSEEIDQELLAVDQMIGSVVQIFMLPDKEQAKAEMVALEKALEAGGHGELAKILAPAYGKVLELKFKGEQDVAARVAMLEGIAAGQASPAELVNAALWYLRAIEMLRKLQPEIWTRLRSAAENPAEPVDESLTVALAASAEIIEVTREGSQKRRCDFRPMRLGPSIVRPYVPGMRDLVRVLHADAVRCEQAGDVDGLVDRLAIAFRMSAHLSGDGALLSALTAHRIFAVSAELAPVNPRLHPLSDEQRAILFASVDAMSRKDPFGYLAAAATDRKQVDDWLRPLLPGGAASAIPIGPAGLGAAGEDLAAAKLKLTESLQGDRLLLMLVLNDSTRFAPAEDDKEAVTAETRFTDALQDTIDVEQWRSARQRGIALRGRMNDDPQWSAQAFAVITETPTILIAPLGELMRGARGELRRLALALQPALPQPGPARQPGETSEPVATP